MDVDEIKAAADAAERTLTDLRSSRDETKARLDALEDRYADLLVKVETPRGRFGPSQSERKADAGRELKAILRGEEKAMAGNSGPDGGFGVAPSLDAMVRDQLVDVTPMRQVAQVIETGPQPEFLLGRRGAASGWAGETSDRAETATPELAKIAPSGGELYAAARLSHWLTEDAGFDAEQWLRQNIVDEFSVQEGAAFVSDDGIGKPHGFLSAGTSTAADGTRTAGALQYRATGTSGGFDATDPAPVLVELVHDLRPGYRPGASWMMASSTASAVRKLKDADGRFLWADSLAAGTPPMLLGYPVYLAEDMPAIAADSFSIAFGDWMRGYVVCDRPGLRIVRDEVTTRGQTILYVSRRVHGSILDDDAIKLLRFGTG